NLEVYLPEAHTDFIFAIISEQFGFIGGSIVVSLFFLLIYRMIHISLESNDPFGSYLCTGVIGMITFQVFQNIGMTIG
ncbi:FtsW/RodA/SpoVE family cell cycle protein, partial [Bacillus sp. GbtcB15]